MPKYRILTLDELKNLEKDFIDYLVVNGITKDDWEKLKEKEIEKAQEITELFSDVVFEQIFRKAEYLIKFDKSAIFAFRCGEDAIDLVSIETNSPNIDFRNEDEVKKLKISIPEDLTGYQASKSYNTIREKEIFNMVESGCIITDSQWFDALEKLI